MYIRPTIWLTIFYLVYISISGGVSRGRVCYQGGYPIYFWNLKLKKKSDHIKFGCVKLKHLIFFVSKKILFLTYSCTYDSVYPDSGVDCHSFKIVNPILIGFVSQLNLRAAVAQSCS